MAEGRRGDAASSPRGRSILWGVLAIVGLLGSIAFAMALYLAAPIERELVVPTGADIPSHLWRVRLVTEQGLDALFDSAPLTIQTEPRPFGIARARLAALRGGGEPLAAHVRDGGGFGGRGRVLGLGARACGEGASVGRTDLRGRRRLLDPLRVHEQGLPRQHVRRGDAHRRRRDGPARGGETRRNARRHRVAGRHPRDALADRHAARGRPRPLRSGSGPIRVGGTRGRETAHGDGGRARGGDGGGRLRRRGDPNSCSPRARTPRRKVRGRGSD